MQGVSLRLRVAMVVAAAAVLCAVVMAVLGTRITRERIEHVASGASMDVAVMLVDDLEARGLTPARLLADAELRTPASEFLEQRLQQLNRSGASWNNAAILLPQGDRWLVLARADASHSDRQLRKPGETIAMLGGGSSQVPSLEHPTSGWFRTELNEWFGTAAPIRSADSGGSVEPAIGVVSMTMHIDDVHDFWAEVLHHVLLALGISVIAGLLLGWTSAGLIVRPIEAVRRFAGGLGRREYATRMREHGAPEIRRLQRDMNQLAEDLSQRDARLLRRMARMAETRDPRETHAHVMRVSGVSLELFDGWLERHPMDPQQASFAREVLESAAVLHDVGKVGVSDLVLRKPGKLDESEFASMKRHSILGAALLPGDDAYDVAAREVALRHHERWDGKGYPGKADLASAEGDICELLELPMPSTGLAGSDIPLFARIVSIADVYDALRSARAYKQPWPEEQVLETIRAEAGKAFDPELVEIFLARHDRVRAAWERHPEAAERA